MAETTTEQVIGLLTEAGWEPVSDTHTETVRIPTRRSPLSGKGQGGELATFGGRKRFEKPGSDWRVTVRPRTTNFYRVEAGGGMRDFVQYATGDVEAIRRHLWPNHERAS